MQSALRTHKESYNIRMSIHANQMLVNKDKDLKLILRLAHKALSFTFILNHFEVLGDESGTYMNRQVHHSSDPKQRPCLCLQSRGDNNSHKKEL